MQICDTVRHPIRMTGICQKCGAVEDVVFGPAGQVLSCVNCTRIAAEARDSQERTARKDAIDKHTLEAAARSIEKDAVDVGSKIAGVLIGTVALFKSGDQKDAIKL